MRLARLFRAAAAAVLALSLALPAGAAAPAAAVAPAQPWAQSVSDLPPDPAVRFGTLPNGLRYAIRRQSVPPGQAALRLWIGAGSLMETDSQQGLAHLLEHMAFNGSKAVPEGEMIKMLQRLGLAFGADTNASTEFSQTIYKLDLPRTDAATVDTSLMLLREAASNLLIGEAAVERERGVVLSEERARDTPNYRLLVDRLQFLMKGQRLPLRLPIGKVEVLRSAPAAEIAAYYHAWYRPERAAVVAVGDFDPDVMEAKIRAQFGDWRAQGPAQPEAPAGAVAARKAEARVKVEPGAPLSLMIAWLDKPDLAPDTTAKRREKLIENLGLAVLNRRYSKLTRGAAPPFLSAFALEGEQERAVRIASLMVRAEPGRWREALAAAEQEQRRAVTFGVQQDELDREIVEARTSLQAAAAAEATRRPAELAQELLDSLQQRTVVTPPEAELALFEQTVKDLKAQTVSQALQRVFRGQGPLAYLATPAVVEGGDAALLAALDQSQRTAVAAPPAQAQVAWPYADFGPAGRVAESRAIEDLGATFIRFQNGVRLTVKPTTFRDNEVLVRVNVGDGVLDLPADRQSPFWASNAYVEGGLKRIDVEDMERVLAARLYGARFAIGEDAFVISGATRPQDLATQLQVLAAYATEPGWREAAFQRIKAAGRTIHDQFEGTDSGVMARDIQSLLRSGDRRWTFPSRAELAAAQIGDLSGPVTAAMAQGAIEVVVVGDTTVEAAQDAVARTFGALPPRPAAASPPEAARKVAFPAAAGAPVLLRHRGRADQAIGFVAWPTGDFFADPALARADVMLGEVLKLRLLAQLREAEGATYSPDVGYHNSMVFPGYGLISASVEAPPDKQAGIFQEISKIAADLAAADVTPDELARAKAPRVERLQKARVTNGYWLGELSGAQWDPRRIEAVRDAVTGAQAVTAADVRKAAQAYLKPERAFRVQALPEGAAP